MRILHTSDWHLGRSFGPVSLLDDQADFVDELVEVVRAEGIDLVVVAGDVYDRAIAPTEAIVLFRQALRRLREATDRVVVITGNHDGADRVAPYGELVDLTGIHVRGGFDRIGEVIHLEFDDGPLDVLPLPFLDPVLAPEPPGRAELHDAADAADGTDAGPAPARHSHESVLRWAMARTASQRRAARSVAVAHAFVAGGTASDSERLLSVGGTDRVGTEVFAGCSYTALGHLHTPQQVGDLPARYSGSPLPYSFSETAPKSLTLVELDAAGTATVRELPIRTGRRVRTLTGTLDELCARPDREAAACFVRARLTDSGAVLDAKARLAEVYPHVVEIELRPSQTGDGPTVRPPQGSATPLELATAFWSDQTGEPVSPEVETLLTEALEVADRSLHEVDR
jgi:exonuclease SbcD